IFAPLLMYFIGLKKPGELIELPKSSIVTSNIKVSGAEKLDHLKIMGWVIGLLVILVQVAQAVKNKNAAALGFITPNWINAFLFGLALIFHGKIANFLSSVKTAIGGASGILIQFPLYFGIAALMSSGGLIDAFSSLLSDASASQFSILTFLSAGFVNVFVPSGGGQWVVQGPIIVEGCTQLGIPLSKGILALAYGDQLTNMLQPFWALPLLGITGLKVKNIIPYTLTLMLLGTIIFLGAIVIF
ncbi:MAG: TIGR00366 family protein, partial [Flavobacteriales bacterium]